MNDSLVLAVFQLTEFGKLKKLIKKSNNRTCELSEIVNWLPFVPFYAYIIRTVITRHASYVTGLWQMFNTPIVRFVPILFISSHCSPYS